MPADRTKSFKHSTSAYEDLWAPLVDQESMPSPGLSFMANITAIDFSSDTPPPLVDAPPFETILFPPADEMPAPKRQPHSRKKPENHIPRPPNAFILFRSSFIKSQHVSTGVETNHSTLSKIIGITWQSLPDQERQIWHQKAKEALEEHKRRFPKYAFRPVQTKAKGASSEKRKVREVEPKDIKRCEKIAQLLVQGKKGHALENAIQEFDKHHVPEVVTRFEAPITARSYRRSSSAPIPDTENTRTQSSFLQTTSDAPKRKPRAASTRCPSPVSVHDHPSPVDSVVEQRLSLPLKEEATYTFDDFSFDNIALRASSYSCGPLSSMDPMPSFEQEPFPPPLTLDTHFMPMNGWTSSPSPVTPETPHYLDGPDPAVSSPLCYTSFDNLAHVSLEKSFGDFSATFPPVVDQPCTISQSQQHCGAGAGVPFHFNPQTMMGNIDLELLFMESIQTM